MRYHLNEYGFLYIMIGMIFAVIGGATAMGVAVEKAACADYQTHTMIPTKMVSHLWPAQTCYIDTGTRWMPLAEYQQRAITNE